MKTISLSDEEFAALIAAIRERIADDEYVLGDTEYHALLEKLEPKIEIPLDDGWTPAEREMPKPGVLCHIRRGKTLLHDARRGIGLRWSYEADDESGRTTSDNAMGTEWCYAEPVAGREE